MEQLLERYQAQIYRFARRVCRDREDARDVLQETMLAVAKGLREFRGDASFSTWLFTIARSFCVKKRRRSKFAPREERSIDAEPAAAARLGDDRPLPDEVVAHKELEGALDAAIETLAPMYRDVLLLRDVEGLTAPEVAAVLGISGQAVKSRLHRARLALRAQLAPRWALGDGPPRPTCPDVLLMLSQHLEDQISGATCAQMEHHIEGCPSCGAACESLKRTLALCRSTARDDQVPQEVQVSVQRALRELRSAS